MKNRIIIYALLSLALIGLSVPAWAQYPQLGAKVPEFQLLATDNTFYGVTDALNKVSIIYLMGHG